jgi:hypothetical protein
LTILHLAGEVIVFYIDLPRTGNLPTNLEELEDQMVALLTEKARVQRYAGKAVDKLNMLMAELEQHKLKILSGQRKCLLVLIYCESVAAMKALTDLLESGRLRVLAEGVFICLAATTALTVSVRLHDTFHFNTCLQALQAAGTALCFIAVLKCF